MSVTEVFSTWSDIETQDADTLIYVPDSVSTPTLAAGIALFEACSVGHLSQVTQTVYLQGPDFDAGGAGAYNTHRDFARLIFQKANGQQCFVPVSMPKEEMFIGGDLVDETQSDVASLITWCLANVTDVNGVTLSEYVSGVRWRKDA